MSFQDILFSREFLFEGEYVSKDPPMAFSDTLNLGFEAKRLLKEICEDNDFNHLKPIFTTITKTGITINLISHSNLINKYSKELSDLYKEFSQSEFIKNDPELSISKTGGSINIKIATGVDVINTSREYKTNSDGTITIESLEEDHSL